MTSDAPVDDPHDDEVTVRPPKTVAAGVRGVLAGAQAARTQMGARRSVRTLLRVNQPAGFDCPGCAWPEPNDRSHLEFCENGAKAVAEEATRRRVTPSFFRTHSVTDLASRSDYWLGQQGRLTEPVVKWPGRDQYEPISWDAAFELLARELRALPSPDDAVFYTSGRTSNEAAFVYQLFVRVFGTNNLPDCSNMCHESSGVALTQTIGIGKGSVTLDDLHQADLIFVVGQNPGTNHPRMLTALEQAKRNGARVIAVNPLPEAGLLRFRNPQKIRGVVGRGTDIADVFLQVRLAGDLALFQALNHLLVAEEERRPGEVLDAEFIAEHTDGFDALRAHLGNLDWDEVTRATGLTRADIERVAVMVLESNRIIVCWAMGITQHRDAVATIREFVNFLLLRGNIGRPGAGACPVRGHSNVQGDRTMGIHERPPAAFLDALAAEFEFAPPREPGYDTVDAIRAMRDGRARAFFGMGGNFVAAAPDTTVTAAALQSCRLTAHVSTKLNRSHTCTGEIALILPCLGRTDADVGPDGADRFVTVEDSMGIVHASRGALAPPSASLLSEVEIVCRLAAETVGDTGVVDWLGLASDYGLIRDRIARTIPGFDRFNDRVQAAGGFVLPHPARDTRTFTTPTGRARFTVNQLNVLERPPNTLLLQTVRSHDQYNTTIYGLDDRYRGISGGRRVIFVGADDLDGLGLRDGDIVDVVGVTDDDVERRARGFRIVTYPVPVGTCAGYFPELNVLVPLDSTALESGTPTSKSILVRLERAEER